VLTKGLEMRSLLHREGGRGVARKPGDLPEGSFNQVSTGDDGKVPALY